MPDADRQRETLFRALGSGRGLERRASPPVIARSNQDPIAAFISNAERSLATVVRVSSDREAPRAVRDFLLSEGLPPRVHLGAGLKIEQSLWTQAGVSCLPEPPVEAGACAVTRAFAAIGETGALAFATGEGGPTSYNFLADRHVVLVDEQDVLPSLDSLWALLRRRFPARTPACVNLISGPSRSADIEQTMLLGAHGPRRLHVLLSAESAHAEEERRP